MMRGKSKKDKKHSGRYTPKILKPQMKFDDIKSDALEPQKYYDDWTDWRDGMRDVTYLDWKKKNKIKKIRIQKVKKLTIFTKKLQ